MMTDEEKARRVREVKLRLRKGWEEIYGPAALEKARIEREKEIQKREKEHLQKVSNDFYLYKISLTSKVGMEIDLCADFDARHRLIDKIADEECGDDQDFREEMHLYNDMFMGNLSRMEGFLNTKISDDKTCEYYKEFLKTIMISKKYSLVDITNLDNKWLVRFYDELNQPESNNKINMMCLKVGNTQRLIER